MFSKGDFKDKSCGKDVLFSVGAFKDKSCEQDVFSEGASKDKRWMCLALVGAFKDNFCDKGCA